MGQTKFILSKRKSSTNFWRIIGKNQLSDFKGGTPGSTVRFKQQKVPNNCLNKDALTKHNAFFEQLHLVYTPETKTIFGKNRGES